MHHGLRAIAIALSLPAGCGPTPATPDAAAADAASVDAPTSCGLDARPPDAPGPGDTGPPSCELAARPELRFARRVLETDYLSDGAGVFDVNGDGLADVVTDQAWYEAPCLLPHPIRERTVYAPLEGWAAGFGAYPMDVDRDGCTDVVVPARPLEPVVWYEHPCVGDVPSGTDGAWARHEIVGAGVIGIETAMLADLFGDDRPVLLASDGSTAGPLSYAYLAPGPDPTAPWEMHHLGPAGFANATPFSHGIGAGDVDGDGDLDVLSSFGWLEQSAGTWIDHLDPSPFPAPADVEWRAHCARMFTTDVGCDGRADVICSRPHAAGIHWLEQDDTGTFTDHLIDASVRNMHAIDLEDLDGDGVPEIVSGTRWCGHCYVPGGAASDDATPYVVYYSLERAGGVARYTPHVIDDSSGVGSTIDVGDVTGDGRPDIVTASKRGLFVFEQLP